jgi:pimeloyl-ACP methyl ester carboxylesterase
MGLGSQMLAWREGFCEQLASHGFYVVRFDNRDIGLSSRIDQGVPPTLFSVGSRSFGHRVRPPYTLRDMACDVIGLMDALRTPKAHLVGASMGGMIAQLCAINHPDRVLSLTSMMSTTGDRDLPGPDWSVRREFLRPMPTSPGPQLERLVKIRQLVGSPSFFDENAVRSYFQSVVERSSDRTGVRRQLLAVLDARSRRGGLQKLRAPSLVIHGLADKLLPASHGARTARTIPGAKLQLVEALGHDLPEAFWPSLTRSISSHAHAAA